MADDIILIPGHDETHTVTVGALLLRTDTLGRRSLWQDSELIATEIGPDSNRWLRMLLDIKNAPLPVANIAYIGGPFCTFAHILGDQYNHTVYEEHAEYSLFLPAATTLVAGDWHSRLDGLYHVIVYDMATPPTVEEKAVLTAHLANRGILVL